MTNVAHTLPHIKYIVTGVSYMTAFISAMVSLAIGFGIGWYVKGRGLSGVKIDAANAAQEVKTVVADSEAKIHTIT